jgi:glycosyltransferase involved in cell wall biosynthesis
VPITTVVYDLLPLTLPPGNFVDGVKELFEGWLRRAIVASDNLVCISRTVADELIAYIIRYGLGRKGLKVGYWRLGTNVPVTSKCPTDSPVRRVPGPYALMVGTIEPRKNHALALDAFEQLWQQDSDLLLVVAGKAGWLVDELLKRFRSHTFCNKKLFFFERISDGEMEFLYRNAAALLFPSKGEGFGLPLVEAAQYGTPIICSDIPVFHEIAGTHATYVPIENAACLAHAIAAWQIQIAAGTAPQSANIPRITWDQSAESLFDVLRQSVWYWHHP